MHAPRRLILLPLLVLVAAGFTASTGAHAQPLPPDCTIEGVQASCIPELWYGPGPEDELSYDWTGPHGFTASNRFVEVFDGGVYTLTLTRIADGAPTVTLMGVASTTRSSSIIGRSVGSETTMTSALPSRRHGTKP